METSVKQTASYQRKIIKQLDILPDKRPLFSAFETEMIKKYFPSKGVAIAKILGKTEKQIRNKARILELKLNASKEEDKVG